MRRESVEAILAKIDNAIGPPESETEEQHDKRVEWMEREARRRQIRRSAG